MVGDLLRVWVTLAFYTAFAHGKPGRYAAIEMGVVALMAAITLALIRLGQPQAPQLGYALAYGVAAVVVSIAFFRGSRAVRSFA